MARDCPYCGQWLSSGDLLQGYCWNCKRTVDFGDDEVRTDGGHLPSDGAPRHQRWVKDHFDEPMAAYEYEERHIDVRFANLYCDDCGRRADHRILVDAKRDVTETECSSCHTVDVTPGGVR